MADVVGFIRQLSHDLRNQLNAVELQSAFLKEIANEAEVKEEIKRLREMLSEMGTSLHRLTSSLATVRLNEMRYEAAAFLEDLQQKVATQFPEANGEIDWKIEVGASALNIDPQLLTQALLELIGNAFLHERGSGKIRIAATAKDTLRLTITEPKTNFAQTTEKWGQEPFRKVKHGHYGVGLHRVRHIIEAHGGELRASHDSSSSSLITTIVLPLAA